MEENFPKTERFVTCHVERKRGGGGRDAENRRRAESRKQEKTEELEVVKNQLEQEQKNLDEQNFATDINKCI